MGLICGSELLQAVLRAWTEAVLGAAAVKGWWYGGADQGYEDLRGHGGTRVYRRRAIAEIGRLRHWVGMIWVLYVVDAGLRVEAWRKGDRRPVERPRSRQRDGHLQWLPVRGQGGVPVYVASH